MEGLAVGRMFEKISLYADDMLLYLANLHRALEAAIKVIEEFGEIVGLCINWAKSFRRFRRHAWQGVWYFPTLSITT